MNDSAKKMDKLSLELPPILKFSDSDMPIPLLFVLTPFWCPESTQTQEIWGSTERDKGEMKNEQKSSNIKAQRMEASSAESFQEFLPQKFHLATVTALAKGLEGDGGWPAMEGPSSQHILPVLPTRVENHDSE